jgi:hypothetical protein
MPLQRRFIRTFSPRFASLVEAGKKRQTIRTTPKRLPHVGDLFEARAWTARPYGSPQRLLIAAPILAVADIQITRATCHIDRVELAPEHLDEFARADGFTGWDDLIAYFKPDLPFAGILISW